MRNLNHPSPHFNEGKMARFCSFAPSSLLWGGGGVEEGRGIIVSFYSVQDCRWAHFFLAIIKRLLFTLQNLGNVIEPATINFRNSYNLVFVQVISWSVKGEHRILLSLITSLTESMQVRQNANVSNL